MTEVDYIYDFLHDPDKHRWPQPIVDYLLDMATDEINSRVAAFLKARDISREKAQLTQLGTDTKTSTLQVKDGIDVYDLPKNFLRITSVLYEGCFIPHQIPDCCDTVECDEDCPDEIVKSYNVSGLPKGKIKISPKPSKVIETTVTTTKVTADVLDEASLYGWGFENIEPKISLQDTTTCEVHSREIVFGKLEVTYEVPKDLGFDDKPTDAEILNELVSDRQLRKFYVCGHLFRDDKDSQSRTLGIEELELFNNRLEVMLGKYLELYDLNNILELESAKDGFINKERNADILGRDIIAAEKEALAEIKRKNEARNHKSKFDILGVR